MDVLGLLLWWYMAVLFEQLPSMSSASQFIALAVEILPDGWRSSFLGLPLEPAFCQYWGGRMGIWPYQRILHMRALRIRSCPETT